MSLGARLHLQDQSVDGRKLIEALSEAARGARAGGGIFAFASTGGIDMLLRDKSLRRLAKDRGFDLVVVVDAITDERALERLTAATEELPKLHARVLVHETAYLLHPKLCWFTDGSKVRLVVGSGNLTPGGLRTNYEGFLTLELDKAEAKAALTEIDDFLRRWDHRLLPCDDPAAVARAKQNKFRGGSGSRMKPPPAGELRKAAELPDSDAEVLIVEVSKNVDKRTQLDIGIDVFLGFFGASPDGGRILIQSVDSKGATGIIETRAIFPTKSRNYRFEAGAGAGRPYPKLGGGRPFGVFVRMPNDVFRYCLIWPDDSGHAEIDAVLTRYRGAAKKQRPMRRITTSLGELDEAWPGCQLLRAVATP